ncbi:hypothetical protein E4U41_001432 [Claviceps citrina]|nr:hypothetical protein E4U41_001432 [Claviceps citrina]
MATFLAAAVHAAAVEPRALLNYSLKCARGLYSGPDPADVFKKMTHYICIEQGHCEASEGPDRFDRDIVDSGCLRCPPFLDPAIKGCTVTDSSSGGGDEGSVGA